MTTSFGQSLSKDVMNTFASKIRKDTRLKQLGAVAKKSASYEIANKYSVRVGELVSESIAENTKTLQYMSSEVADEVLTPLLSADYEMVKDVAKTVQHNMNVANGLGIASLTPDLDTNRIEGFIEKVASYSNFEDARWVLGEPIVNYSQAVVDQAIKKNADANTRMGLQPKIVRKTGASEIRTGVKKIRGRSYSYTYKVPCDWCSNLEGEYDYNDVKGTGNDVYRRHEGCRCTVTYVQGTKRQDVWSKREWTEEDAERQRQIVQIHEKRFSLHHNKTGNMTPDEYADYLRDREFGEKNYTQIMLPKDEYAHVISEINTNLPDEKRKRGVVSHIVGNYTYTFINYGFNDYVIVKKLPIIDVGDEL